MCFLAAMPSEVGVMARDIVARWQRRTMTQNGAVVKTPGEAYFAYLSGEGAAGDDRRRFRPSDLDTGEDVWYGPPLPRTGHRFKTEHSRESRSRQAWRLYKGYSGLRLVCF